MSKTTPPTQPATVITKADAQPLASVAPAHVGISLGTRTLGTYGEAFDLPGNRRAYTYDHQPGNLKAHRLGNACQRAATASAGDSIDRGLGLLKELQAEGFGVFEAETSRWHAASVAAQHAATLANIAAFVACDASAISYLTLGEYRSALLKILNQAKANE